MRVYYDKLGEEMLYIISIYDSLLLLYLRTEQVMRLELQLRSLRRFFLANNNNCSLNLCVCCKKREGVDKDRIFIAEFHLLS